MPTKNSSTATKSTSAKKSTTKKSNAKAKKNTEPGLRQLFLKELKDIYWAEKNLLKALPKLQKAATSEELANAIGEHIMVTEKQVTRVEEVFGLMDEKPKAEKCEAMEGLIEEGEEVIKDTEDGSATRDAGIIIASQKVEHYEIAAYGSLVQLAITLGEDDVADILSEILNEEKEADQLLTKIAEEDINYEAAEEQVEEE